MLPDIDQCRMQTNTQAENHNDIIPKKEERRLYREMNNTPHGIKQKPGRQLKEQRPVQ